MILRAALSFVALVAGSAAGEVSGQCGPEQLSYIYRGLCCSGNPGRALKGVQPHIHTCRLGRLLLESVFRH